MSGSRRRIRFCKHGKVRFTSHRDVARIWERALRRAEVPVMYSNGFNPRPRISFGLALSTGYSSDAEYLDVVVDTAWAQCVDDAALARALTEALPDGMAVLATAALEPGEPSLQHAVTSCTWRIDTAGAEAPADRRGAGSGAGGQRAASRARAQGTHRHRRHPPRGALSRSSSDNHRPPDNPRPSSRLPRLQPARNRQRPTIRQQLTA